jgi:hypothetical protein
MNFDEIIRLLESELRSRLVAAQRNKQRGLNIAEARAMAEADHVRYAIRLFARLRRAEKRVDAASGSLV